MSSRLRICVARCLYYKHRGTRYQKSEQEIRPIACRKSETGRKKNGNECNLIGKRFRTVLLAASFFVILIFLFTQATHLRLYSEFLCKHV